MNTRKNSIKWSLIAYWRLIVITTTLLIILIVALKSAGFFNQFELLLYDQFVRLTTKSEQKSTQIVVITINDREMSEYNWPLTDEKLAEILDQILALNPTAIGIDIYRPEKIDPGGDSLNALLEENNNIIGISKFGLADEVIINAHPELASDGHFGFSDVLVDSDGVVRRGLLFLDDGKEFMHSFALKVAMRHLQEKNIVPVASNNNYMQLGATTYIPLDSNSGGYVNADSRGYQFLINFDKAYSEMEILTLTEFKDKYDQISLENQIVLIGTNSELVKDYFRTPFSKSGDISNQFPGVMIHATAVLQLVNQALEENKPIRYFSEFHETIILIAVIMLTIWMVLAFRQHFIILAFILAGSCILLLILGMSFRNNIWIPFGSTLVSFFAACVLSIGLLSYIRAREKRILASLFSKYLSKEMLAEIWSSRDTILADGLPQSQKLFVTVLMADVADSTPAAIKLESSEFMQWIGISMELLAEKIIKRGGLIEKFQGDGITAMFGAPIPSKTNEETQSDALSAVNACVDIQLEIDRLNQISSKKSWPPITLRMGLASGEVVAGSIGHKNRMQYTILGEAPNLSARLESLGKEILAQDQNPAKTIVLMSKETVSLIDDGYSVKDMGEFYLKGIETKTQVYRLL